MTTAVKYTPLSDLPFVPVERCAQVLANKTQCWRPGEVLVSSGDAPAKEPVKAESVSPSYQLCQMHATIQKRAASLGAGALDKMLGVQLRAQTSALPHAREERNYVPTPQEKVFDDMMAPEDSKEYKEFQKELKEIPDQGQGQEATPAKK